MDVLLWVKQWRYWWYAKRFINLRISAIRAALNVTFVAGFLRLKIKQFCQIGSMNRVSLKKFTINIGIKQEIGRYSNNWKPTEILEKNQKQLKMYLTILSAIKYLYMLQMLEWVESHDLKSQKPQHGVPWEALLLLFLQFARGSNWCLMRKHTNHNIV